MVVVRNVGVCSFEEDTDTVRYVVPVSSGVPPSVTVICKVYVFDADVGVSRSITDFNFSLLASNSKNPPVSPLTMLNVFDVDESSSVIVNSLIVVPIAATSDILAVKLVAEKAGALSLKSTNSTRTVLSVDFIVEPPSLAFTTIS